MDERRLELALRFKQREDELDRQHQQLPGTNEGVWIDGYLAGLKGPEVLHGAMVAINENLALEADYHHVLGTLLEVKRLIEKDIDKAGLSLV